MDMLQVKKDKIVASGQPVNLRGVCLGGWMNMEDFMVGYTGAEHHQRAVMAEVLGPARAEFFFERLLDHFFTEEDAAFLQSLGANLLRISLNYRHFESDLEPGKYLEKGFARLDRAIGWCAAHGLYVILDLHAVPGWQNPDWHSDNQLRSSLFWRFKEFQDRFVALWEEFARHYKGNPAVAGYNLMNEPVTGDTYGRLPYAYKPNWDVINQIYRQTAAAIRAIDPDHILFLEGDQFSARFSGLEAPFDKNLVYSSHNYNASTNGPGKYPGKTAGENWDMEKQRRVFENQEGTLFARKYKVPLWVGEFGANLSSSKEEAPDRLRALDDQMAVFNRAGIHWSLWSYKDVGAMGLLVLKKDSPYRKAIAPVLKANQLIGTDFPSWYGWNKPAIAWQLGEIADSIRSAAADARIEVENNQQYFRQSALACYSASLLQPVYARCFEKMSEKEIDTVLSSWCIRNCQPQQELIDVLKVRWSGKA